MKDIVTTIEKPKLKIFIAHAHLNGKLVQKFLQLLKAHLKINGRYEYEIWIDAKIVTGSEWDESIQESDLAILLLSPAFFSSDYILDKELPHLYQMTKMSDGKEKIQLKKHIVPVGLVKINHNGNLNGINDTQIFLHKVPGKDGKFFNELNTVVRNEFVMNLVSEMNRKMDKAYGNTP